MVLFYTKQTIWYGLFGFNKECSKTVFILSLKKAFCVMLYSHGHGIWLTVVRNNVYFDHVVIYKDLNWCQYGFLYPFKNFKDYKQMCPKNKEIDTRQRFQWKNLTVLWSVFLFLMLHVLIQVFVLQTLCR